MENVHAIHCSFCCPHNYDLRGRRQIIKQPSRLYINGGGYSCLCYCSPSVDQGKRSECSAVDTQFTVQDNSFRPVGYMIPPPQTFSYPLLVSGQCLTPLLLSSLFLKSVCLTPLYLSSLFLENVSYLFLSSLSLDSVSVSHSPNSLFHVSTKCLRVSLLFLSLTCFWKVSASLPFLSLFPVSRKFQCPTPLPHFSVSRRCLTPLLLSFRFLESLSVSLHFLSLPCF